MPSDRLDSWKKIADYIGKDPRTAMRWEKERGLPVRRIPGGKGSAVFAFEDELREWMAHQGDIQTEQPSQVPPRNYRRLGIAASGVLALTTISFIALNA